MTFPAIREEPYKGSVPEITVNVPEITVGRIKTNWWRPLLERPIQPISAT